MGTVGTVRRVRAVVMREPGRVEVRDDVELAPPGPGEVRVRMRAAGVCHSDVSTSDGAMLAPTPIVLGHEGAGVVSEVGEGVTHLAAGDAVVLSWVPQCGACFHCERAEGHLCERANVALASGGLLDGSPRFRLGGHPLYQMGATGAFAEETVVPAAGAVKVDADLEPRLAALLGCSVITGVGAAVHTGKVAPGERVAVLGCGGVGLNVVQGASIAGAGQVIAIDTNTAALDLASSLGATHSVDAGAGDPVSVVMRLTDQRGADVVFEVAGLPATIDQALAMARRGGRVVLVGIPHMTTVVNVAAFLGLLFAAKTITGCWYGSSNVHTDVPALVAMHREGRLRLDPLVSRTIGLGDVPGALDDVRRGTLGRCVVVFDA